MNVGEFRNDYGTTIFSGASTTHDISRLRIQTSTSDRVIVNGTTANFKGFFHIGDTTGAIGRVYMTNSTVSIASDVNVGYVSGATATLETSGGTTTLPYASYFGKVAGSTGSFAVHGGNITHSGRLNIGCSGVNNQTGGEGSFYIGEGGVTFDTGNNTATVLNFAADGNSSGQIRKTGSGTLVLDKLPRTHGGIAVQQGTLRLASGATVGAAYAPSADSLAPNCDAELLHRWSFTAGSPVDSVGARTATIYGSVDNDRTGADTDTISFPGGNTLSVHYMDLGFGAIPWHTDAGDCAMELDEVRIWKGALSGAQLEKNAKLGPDALPLVGIDATTGPVDVASGAAFDLGGNSISYGSLAGSGTVSNGTVAVTGELKTVGATVGTDGVLDLTAATVTYDGPAPSGALVLARAENGGAIVGRPAAGSIPSGYTVSATANYVRLVKSGLMILIK